MMVMRTLPYAAIALAALFAVDACGSSNASPVAPSVPTMAGDWSGAMAYTQLSSTGTSTPISQAVSLSLTQAGPFLSGTWTTTQGQVRSGTVGGSLNNNTFTGSFTYSTLNANNTMCAGTLAVSGTVNGTSLVWTSPVVNENCSNAPTNITFTAVKQ